MPCIGGRDGWLSLALVIDYSMRQLLGWCLSRTGNASTASATLEQTLITRHGTLGRAQQPFPLRSDSYGTAAAFRHWIRVLQPDPRHLTMSAHGGET